MDAAGRVRPMLHEVACQEWGLLGTGAKAAPQEADTRIVRGEKNRRTKGEGR